MSMMLPSGIATLVWLLRADHPTLSDNRVHVEPLSVDRQVSFRGVFVPLWLSSFPPMRTMLPSGIATEVW